MEFPMTGHRTFHQPPHTTSTPNKSNLNDDSLVLARSTIRAELALSSLPADFRAFVRLYLAGSPVDDTTLRSVSACINVDAEAADILLASDLLVDYSPKRSYEAVVLKRLLVVLESEGVTPPDCLYERLCLVLGKKSNDSNGEEMFHRVYFNFDERDDWLIIRENAEQISGGTTGLACWQAACVLAEYFRCGALAEIAVAAERPLTVLELGAGCGLVGLSAAKFDRRKTVGRLILTDHNERVLARLRENVALNFKRSENICEGLTVDVSTLDWTDCSYVLEKLQPDIVCAADVVYDPEIISPFCDVLTALLTRQGKDSVKLMVRHSLAIVACTLRNADTFELFRQELSKRRLAWTESSLAPGERIFRSANGSERFCIDGETIFPTSSSLCLPVVVLEIRAESTLSS